MNAKALKHGWHRVAVPELALSAFTIGVAVFVPSGGHSSKVSTHKRSPRSRTDYPRRHNKGGESIPGVQPCTAMPQG